MRSPGHNGKMVCKSNITVLSLANHKLVFEFVNAELKANSRLTFPVIIWCYGGISSLQLEARGPNGASANVDFHSPNTRRPRFKLPFGMF
jgi:hypothetical protein